MMRLSFSKLAAGVGGIGVALALTAGAGIASADPVDDAVNTTCNYGQVMAALQVVNPGAAAQVNASGQAKAQLRMFLNAGPDQRRNMLNMAMAYPQFQQYVNDLGSVAGSCNNY